MRGVQQHAVESRLAQMRSRARHRLCHTTNLGLAHRTGGHLTVGIVELSDRCRQRRRGRTERLPGASGSPPVPDLPEDPPAGLVHRIRQRAKGRDVLVEVDRGLRITGAIGHRHAAHHQTAAVILDPRDLVVKIVLRRFAAPDGEVNAVRREVEPIGYLDGPELNRAEQAGISGVHCRLVVVVGAQALAASCSMKASASNGS